MTKEEAKQAIEEYLNAFTIGDLLITIASLKFGGELKSVTEALDIPQFPTELAAKTESLVNALSDYKSVLINALKGQLSPVTEEWSEVIDAD